jgi:hypothetical protein
MIRSHGSRLVLIWLSVLSFTTSLAITISVFDRTTLAAMSKPWLASAAVCFALGLMWWTRPRVLKGRLSLARYEPAPTLLATLPLVLATAGFVVLSYLSDGVHGFIYHRLYYARLLSESYWPVDLLTELFLAAIVVWLLRGFLLRLGSGTDTADALSSTVSSLPSAFPLGLLALGLLLSTASLSAINVNFWRYWATADGWATIGHYPFTLTDPVHVAQGGVSLYFVSYPLLPALLSITYGVVGHNTLASYMPIILGNTLLPLAIYLTVKEITGKPLLSLLFAAATASFPLLRSYTMDVGEADGLLMTTVAFAAYFTLRARRVDAGRRAQVASGLAAAVASFSRAEGVLYAGAMFVTSLPSRWRDRRFWLSAIAFAAGIAPFSAVCIREWGMLWPGNHSGTISLSNFTRTLEVVQRSDLFSFYANALGLSKPALTAISGALLLCLVVSALQMVRRDLHLAWMPATALGNVAMVFLVGPIPAEAAKFHDFFRHISYGFPLLAVTLAYGANELLGSLRGRWRQSGSVALSALLAALVLTEIWLLQGPVRPFDTARSPLMTSDVHVTAAELVAQPLPLPVMNFRHAGATYIPNSDAYLATYPDNVYSYYSRADVREFDNPADYYAAAEAVFLTLLVLGIVPSIATEALGPRRATAVQTSVAGP